MPIDFRPRHHNCLLCGKPHTLFGLFCSAVHRDAYEAAEMLRDLGGSWEAQFLAHFDQYNHRHMTESILYDMLIGIPGVVDVEITQEEVGQVNLGLRIAQSYDVHWLDSLTNALDVIKPAGVTFNVTLLDCLCHETVVGKSCPIHG